MENYLLEISVIIGLSIYTLAIVIYTNKTYQNNRVK